jgi:two-component system, OmpR family, sensor histidine kinase KdpD
MKMNEDRPSPEQMLERARQEQRNEAARNGRGRLKLFFGYAAGVGKTYAMLQAARRLAAEGREVVVGYVEPHGREETEALLEGLEQLPTLSIEYRGTKLREFDLDAALARHPELLLVDELAHSNAEGSRHVKRWQDVEELLASGIDVYSTVNVQHVESLNDVIAKISGVTVRETVPDRLLREADEVVLVDLPPEELLDRLQQGKVYVPQQALLAMSSFFRRENLVALREIALREAASRVHDDVESARRHSAAKSPWPTADRLLVCVGPSPTSAKVVRAAKRFADQMASPWVAVYVDRGDAPPSEADQEMVRRHLGLAERLGAETARLIGADLAEAILDFCHRHNVTKIVVGKSPPTRRLWRRRMLIDRLLENSGEIDVLVVRGVNEPDALAAASAKQRPRLAYWLGTTGVLAAASLLCVGFHRLGFSEANLVMTYLLAVVICAVSFGPRPAAAASLAAVLLFDVLFTEPYYHVTVHDSQYLVTFAVMLGVGLTASKLTARVRQQMEVARSNEQRTDALYRLSNRLSKAAEPKSVIAEAEHSVGEVFDAYAVIYTPNELGRLLPIVDDLHLFASSASEFAAAQWVYDNDQPAGRGTDTLPSAQSLYLPLSTPARVTGVLALQRNEGDAAFSIEERHFLITFASHIAFVLERAILSEEAELAKVAAETELLRSSLLSAVSHDIRTPLAGIAGASSTLLTTYDTLDAETRQELLTSIGEEAMRLTHLVENLLHMTRLTGHSVKIDRQWHPVDEVIGSALTRMESSLRGRQVDVQLDNAVPLAFIDALLVEQLLVNLIENSTKYSPEGTPIRIESNAVSGGVELVVLDRGSGFIPGDEQRAFEMFFRGGTLAPDRGGSGIGLAICKAVADVHGGTIRAANRSDGGAVVSVCLPLLGTPPAIPESLPDEVTT